MKILKNAAYFGDRVYGPRDLSKFNSRKGALIWKLKSEWLIKTGAWDGITDYQTWDKVQRSGGPGRKDAGGPEYKRDVLQSIVDRIIGNRPQNIATV